LLYHSLIKKRRQHLNFKLTSDRPFLVLSLLDTAVISFVHECKDKIDELFEVIKRCQLLHPDLENSFSDDSDEYADVNGNDFGGNFPIDYGAFDHNHSAELGEDNEEDALDESSINRMMQGLGVRADLVAPEVNGEDALSEQEGQFEDAD
jgi:hypothetical protein